MRLMRTFQAPTAAATSSSPSTPVATALLELHDVVASYGAIQALRGISLEVHRGEIVTMLGGNGAGKSTILRTISGLMHPRSGRVEFDGHDITAVPAHKLVRLGIGHAPEGRRIFNRLTVLENLQMGAYSRHDKAEIASDYDRVFGLFPRLQERHSQSAGTLSGGEQQMLAIARALLARPKMLMLDEPSLGLAPQVVALIFQIVKSIVAEGTTILLVEQNAHMALRVAKYAHVLEVGTLVTSGPAEELARDDKIRKAYLGVH